MPRVREEWSKKDRCIWYCTERKKYRLDVNRQGHRFRDSFSTLADARRARDREERSIEGTNELSTSTQLKDITVGQVISGFLNEQILKGMDSAALEVVEKLNTNQGFTDLLHKAFRTGPPPKVNKELPAYMTDKRNLETFLRKEKNGICRKKVLQFKGRQALWYVEGRLKEPFFGPNGTWEIPETPVKRTVAREITSLRKAWEYFRLDYPEVPNPWSTSLLKNIDAPETSRIHRSLESGELEKIIEACQHSLGLNKYYMPVAIYMAHELGMRRQEILNLQSKDIDHIKSLITIRKSKTDKRQKSPGRIIPLTESVAEALLRLEDFVGSRRDGKIRIFHDDEKIFGKMTFNAFEKAWNWIRLNAKLEKPFAFQDFRVTAINRFDKILTPTQIRIVVGHRGKNVTEGYIDRGTTYEDRMAIKEILDLHSKGWEKLKSRMTLDEYQKLSVLEMIKVLTSVNTPIAEQTEAEPKRKSRVIHHT
jgi:integrase